MRLSCCHIDFYEEEFKAERADNLQAHTGLYLREEVADGS
jgi:hypothetical protein